MGRVRRSDIEQLLQEARAIELLANEVEVPVDRTEEYWNLSADLITLVLDMEELQSARPEVDSHDPTLFTLKHRLRTISARLAELSRV